MHEQGLPLGGVEGAQGLVGGEPGEREAAGLGPVERGGLAGEGADGGGDQFGVGAVFDGVPADEADDLVAGGELGDGAADGLDLAGQVPAHDEREADVEHAVEPALADLPVDGVDAGSADPDEHGVGADLRVGHLGVLDDLGAAVLPDDDGFHGASQRDRRVISIRPRREGADPASGSRHIDRTDIVNLTLTGYHR
ncbi:hypothetical protein GCM10025734_27850 [Kitasatospora paranensis]